MLAMLLMFVACQNETETIGITNNAEGLVIYGYSTTEDTRTAFDTPTESHIPFLWSAGDYVWLGATKSKPLAQDTALGHFSFSDGVGVVGTGHIFYNMTGEAKTANVLALQSADGNLGNDGDFSYASIDDDEPCSESEFYLVDGYNVVETWEKWELHELGPVARVVFNFLYSDDMGGRYGFTIPGYFAYDDVAVRFDK